MSRLRLLCCIPDLGGGGAERVMVYIARGLDRERFEVTLALGHRRGPYLPMLPSDLAIIELGSASGVGAVRPLARLLGKDAFDLCFSMVQMNPAALVARALARAPIPVVISARNHYSRSLPAEARFGRLKALALRLLYPRAERVLCVSEGVRDDLVRHFGVRPERTRVIHNPIEIERVRELARVDPRHPWLAPGSGIPVAIAVGKLMEAKGYPDLLRAFRIVRDRAPARLLILGEGPLRREIDEQVAALGLRDDVALLGFRENPYAYIARATVFLHAALWEGFPNVLVEAMACGTPVVSTDCPSGPSEIITSGLDGQLVPVRDPEALARAAIPLIFDAALRRAVAERAGLRVLDFDAPRVVARYAEAFAEVIGAAV